MRWAPWIGFSADTLGTGSVRGWDPAGGIRRGCARGHGARGSDDLKSSGRITISDKSFYRRVKQLRVGRRLAPFRRRGGPRSSARGRRGGSIRFRLPFGGVGGGGLRPRCRGRRAGVGRAGPGRGSVRPLFSGPFAVRSNASDAGRGPIDCIEEEVAVIDLTLQGKGGVGKSFAASCWRTPGATARRSCVSTPTR